MRGDKVYIWQLAGWPNFRFDAARVAAALAEVHEARGRMLARLESLGLSARDESTLDVLTEDAMRTSEIEGERLDEQAVRSSFARRLGVDVAKHRAGSRSIMSRYRISERGDQSQRLPCCIRDSREFSQY